MWIVEGDGRLRRAAVSVAANIVEGSRRRSRQDYARFLNLAEASLTETDYLLLCSKDLAYLAAPTFQALTNETDQITRMLYTLRRRVEPHP